MFVIVGLLSPELKPVGIIFSVEIVVVCELRLLHIIPHLSVNLLGRPDNSLLNGIILILVGVVLAGFALTR